jgi:hypothetical protein
MNQILKSELEQDIVQAFEYWADSKTHIQLGFWRARIIKLGYKLGNLVGEKGN